MLIKVYPEYVEGLAYSNNKQGMELLQSGLVADGLIARYPNNIKLTGDHIRGPTTAVFSDYLCIKYGTGLELGAGPSS